MVAIATETFLQIPIHIIVQQLLPGINQHNPPFRHEKYAPGLVELKGADLHCRQLNPVLADSILVLVILQKPELNRCDILTAAEHGKLVLHREQ
uniref:Uncharacterized protein n=1 Tax=Arundo donax TaxID=35708 RepID=A0A0A8YJ22_ARUDO